MTTRSKGNPNDVRARKVGRLSPGRLRMACALALAAQGLLLCAPPPQTPGYSNQSQPYVLKVERNEVQVDVRVTDRKGNLVTNLKSSDFHVFEDGVKQPLTSFSLESVHNLATAQVSSEGPATIDLGKLPPGRPTVRATENHRLIVLFFDLTSMPVADAMRSLSAAGQFAKNQMTAADLVAVVTYSTRLQVVQDFTNSRTAVEKALHSIRTGESAELSQPGAEGEAGTTNSLGRTVVNQNVGNAFTPDETEFNIFNSDEKLAALQSLAEMLQHLPGRKSVIHFSSGMERTGLENQAQLRATESTSNRADVSIYTMDTRGLVALPPGGDASMAAPSGTAIYTNQAVASNVTKLHGGRETLAALSGDTGGRTFYDMNNFAPAFRQVQDDSSVYYLLAYSPSNTTANGRFRRIRVEVDRPGLKVEARPGYFAPKSYRQFSREDRNLQLRQALDQDAPFLDLPMAVQYSYFLEDARHYTVILAAKIPGSALASLGKKHRHQAEFDFVWRARDKNGRTAGFLRDTLRMKAGNREYEQILKGNVLYQGRLTLPPGTYDLKVVARENGSGKMGSFESSLNLPDLEPGNLNLSSVVISNQAATAGKKHQEARQHGRRARSILTVGRKNLLPSVTNVFRRDQALYVYCESYGPGTDPPAAAPKAQPPSFELMFFRRGVMVSEAGPFPGSVLGNQAGWNRYFADVPLRDFPAGRYRLQVNVMDPSANAAAFAEVPFVIMPSRTPASAKEK